MECCCYYHGHPVPELMLTRQAGNADSCNGNIQVFNYYNTLIPTHITIN